MEMLCNTNLSLVLRNIFLLLLTEINRTLSMFWLTSQKVAKKIGKYALENITWYIWHSYLHDIILEKLTTYGLHILYLPILSSVIRSNVGKQNTLKVSSKKKKKKKFIKIHIGLTIYIAKYIFWITLLLYSKKNDCKANISRKV